LHRLFGGAVPPDPQISIVDDASQLEGADERMAVARYLPQESRIVVACRDGARDVFAETVRHESTHHFFRSSLASQPFWLSEGLAAYMEAGPLAEESDDSRPDPRRLRQFLRVLHQARVPSLDDLMADTSLAISLSDRYAVNWALVYALLHHPDPLLQVRRRALLRRLLDPAADQQPAQERRAEIGRLLLAGVAEEAGSAEAWHHAWLKQIWRLE
jgi:hypothetical protein